ncbi:MAG: ABC transporter permease [Pseudomonadota bacterium]
MRTLYMREVRRFIKVIFQTVLAPVISTLLFLVVFLIAFGRSETTVNGIPFAEFLAPGLIMMAVITNAFQNSSSSLIVGKVQGSIVDMLMPPISPAETAVAVVAGAATRGLLVGFVTAVTIAAFMAVYGTRLPFADPLAILFFSTGAATLFGAIGLLAGVWAEKFDQLAAITNFLITPLTFLSGTFYAISMLPEPFFTISRFNPVFYLIDGFRYGFTGVAEAPILIGAATVLALNVCVGFGCLSLLRSGAKLKS